MNDWAQYFAYLQTTPKQRFEQIPKKDLGSGSAQRDFLYQWFRETNYVKKINLAYSYGLVELDENQRFMVRNSHSRDY